MDRLTVAGPPGFAVEPLGPGRLRLHGLTGGRAWHLGIRAGLGTFDVQRLFFTLPPRLPFRPEPHCIGPIDTQFATDNRWLPPRIDCLVDGVRYFSIWCRVPSLAELLNDPRTRAALGPEAGCANADDGFGERTFSFLGEGSVLVPDGSRTIELAFTGEGGLPGFTEVTAALDSRYERALALDPPVVRAPHPRLFLHGRGATGLDQAAVGDFLRLLDEQLPLPPEGRPTRNEDGREHWDAQDRSACFAFGFALDGREAWYQAALPGIEESLTLEHWGMPAAEADHDPAGDSGAHTSLHWDNDLCQGVTRILAMILFYDWCQARIPADLKDRIERKLLHHGELIFRFSLCGLGNWASFPWSDHNTGTVHALQLLGLVLGDRHPQAAFWHRWGRVYFEDWRASGLYAGPTYYSPQRCNPIVGYIAHVRALCGEDLARPGDGVGLLVHKRLLNCRSGRPDWVVHERYGCDAQLHTGLAAIYGDGHAQWLADDLARRPPTGWLKAQGFRKVLELVHRDPRVPPLPPTGLPRFLHDPAAESFTWRDSWESLVRAGARDETIVAFENHRPFTGVTLGNPLVPRYDWGPAPFRGHISLIRGCTDYLAKPFSGYVNWTRNASCLTVDGCGQIGEGAWFPAPVAPCKLTAMDPPAVSTDGDIRRYRIRADLSAAYDRALGLRWIRTMTICERSDAGGQARFESLEVLDEVDFPAPQLPTFTWHTQVPLGLTGMGAVFSGAAGDLRLELDAGGLPLELAIAPTRYVTSYIPPLGAEPRHLAVCPRSPVTAMRLAWRFTFD